MSQSSDLRWDLPEENDPNQFGPQIEHISLSKRKTDLPVWWQDHFVGIMSLPREPKTFSKAVINPKWIEAMQEEMACIHKNCTWDLVELPSSKFVLSDKWVYTINCKAYGTPQ